MDTPTNMAMITGVMMFDRPLDVARLRLTIERRLLTHARFRQRVSEPRLGSGLPYWEDDPYFDLDAHLFRIALPAPGGDEALMTLAGDMMGMPLDFTKPLWQIHVVENYNSGSACIVRLHHAIGDGLALVQVLLSLADETPDAPLPELTGEDHHPGSLFGRLLQPPLALALRGLRLTERSLRFGLDVLDHPARLVDAARLVGSGARSLAKLLLILPDRRTALRGQCGVVKRVAWSQPIPLEIIKRIGGSMDATLNDVLVSAAAGALRRYLLARSGEIEASDIRAVVPVSIRQPQEFDQLGNRFGLVFLSLPIGVSDSWRRIKVVKRRMDEIKDTPEAAVAFGILTTIGMTPRQIERIIVDIFGMKGTLVLTNVPGPRKMLYLAGAGLKQIMFWVPQPGGLALGLSIISYNNSVIVGFAGDAGLVPEPQRLADFFAQEIAELSAA
jgi:WS/DGAT/MGAT family acyltransferase